jgi:hypothetical protein
MALSSEVKCGKCDKRYSAFRARCPYCGARRGHDGKYATGTDNSKGKTIIALLFMLVLVVAVVVLLVTSTSDKEPTPTPPPSSNIPDEGDVNTVPGLPPVITPTPTPPETPTATPAPAIESVSIRYAGTVTNDFTEKIGNSLLLTCTVVPADAEDVPVWTSSDEEIFKVVPTDTTGKSANVTILKRGDAVLTVTVGDKSAKCDVRGRP